MKFRKLLALLAIPLTAGTLVLAPMAVAPVYASTFTDNACDGLKTINPDQGCDKNPAGTVDNLLKRVINLLSIIVGIAAVIVIIIAGLRFVTSGGSTEDTASAKSAIIYALVGLIVVALAQFIVHFVLKQAT